MDFKNAAELAKLCMEYDTGISEIMLRREISLFGRDREGLLQKMAGYLDIMRESAHRPIEEPGKSVGGFIGGEAALLDRHVRTANPVCGRIMSKAVSYAMAVLETNASMGLIVAAPTAGSSGVVPGVLLALQEEYGCTDGEVSKALFNAGAVGYLAMRNASVSGAVAGCQAEVGTAAAMAASAAVELMGGTPGMCLTAASACIMSLLGLVCDPVGGLVECPCQVRNASGAAVAMSSAEMALSGVKYFISFDEMLDAMYNIGKGLPESLRETALGGCASVPSACGCGCSVRRR